MRTALLLALALTATVTAQTPRFRQLTLPTGPSPRWIAIADVNQDHNPDLIVANAGSDSADDGTIAVLLGDGKGGFHNAPGSPFPAGHLPNDIAVADMNNDGHLDLVVANHQSPYLRIFLGDGTGRFRLAAGSPIDVHSYPHPHGVAVGDFNGDGKADVVTDSWGNNQIEILNGDGTGRLLTPGIFFPTGHRPYERLRTAEFNHDGYPDIVTTNLDDNTVSILLGDGKGGLHNAPGSPFPAGARPWELAVDELNNDGNADLVIIPYQRDISGPAQDAVTVLVGDGHGAFHPMPGTPLPLGDCRGPNSVAAGDLTGHGAHSIAVACAESKSLLLYDPRGQGRFTASSFPIAGGWGSVAIGRVTSDPRADIITANADAGTITFYFPNQSCNPGIIAANSTGESAMAQMIVLYKTPKDPATFDKHYVTTHIPLARKIPGLRKYEVSQGPVVTPFGPSAYHLVATLHFDNMQSMQSSFASPEGRVAGADAQSIADLEILLFDDHEV